MSTFFSIVIIVAGIFQIILFFKVWGMTNDVAALKDLLTDEVARRRKAEAPEAPKEETSPEAKEEPKPEAKPKEPEGNDNDGLGFVMICVAIIVITGIIAMVCSF